MDELDGCIFVVVESIVFQTQLFFENSRLKLSMPGFSFFFMENVCTGNKTYNDWSSDNGQCVRIGLFLDRLGLPSTGRICVQKHFFSSNNQ